MASDSKSRPNSCPSDMSLSCVMPSSDTASDESAKYLFGFVLNRDLERIGASHPPTSSTT